MNTSPHTPPVAPGAACSHLSPRSVCDIQPIWVQSQLPMNTPPLRVDRVTVEGDGDDRESLSQGKEVNP